MNTVVYTVIILILAIIIFYLLDYIKKQNKKIIELRKNLEVREVTDEETESYKEYLNSRIKSYEKT